MSGTWNYRVIEFVEANDNTFRQIHEVHYNENGKPVLYSGDPAVVVWDVAEENAGHDILSRMKEALTKPVLVETDFDT
jgi:hypothetical protein